MAWRSTEPLQHLAISEPSCTRSRIVGMMFIFDRNWQLNWMTLKNVVYFGGFLSGELAALARKKSSYRRCDTA